jgi:hypothetical protein
MTVAKITEAEILSFASKALNASKLCWWRMSLGPILHSFNGKVRYKRNPLKGFPDLCGVCPSGRMWSLELKTKTGKLSEEQVDWQKKLGDANVLVGVARSTQEVLDFIAQAKLT